MLPHWRVLLEWHVPWRHLKFLLSPWSCLLYLRVPFIAVFIPVRAIINKGYTGGWFTSCFGGGRNIKQFVTHWHSFRGQRGRMGCACLWGKEPQLQQLQVLGIYSHLFSLSPCPLSHCLQPISNPITSLESERMLIPDFFPGDKGRRYWDTEHKVPYHCSMSGYDENSTTLWEAPRFLSEERS